MCGIAGIWSQDRSYDTLRRAATEMAAALHSRGPDASGVWVDETNGLALGHARLSIIDLSDAGAQPMVSSCGRYVISYNGEIYNFAELRDELRSAGRSFRGNSDTEVIVEGWAHWGADALLKRMIGMFALAVWDRRDRTLTLARDRMGIKPLYCGRLASGEVMFASELKALRKVGGWRPEIDRQAVAKYLRHGYIPTPRTIYESVTKLQPGTFVVLEGRHASTHAYWRLDDAVLSGQASPFEGSAQEAADALEDILKDAVSRRMIADVPLGAFLSGGIDSSTVVSLMQAHANEEGMPPVRTFSIGFDQPGFDEARYAADIARHLGTDHTELYVTAHQARDVIPTLPDIFDEPFADSSQIPTYLISKLTREHVTVALSGDGGDEAFGGYNRYRVADDLWKRIDTVPHFARRTVAGAMRMMSPSGWDALMRAVPGLSRYPQAGDRLHKLADVLGADGIEDVYRRLVSQWPDPSSIIPGVHEQSALDVSKSLVDVFTSPSGRMRYLDMRTYLPDDILAKVDRASMAVSLETRVPLLDHRVVEFAWRLPPDMVIRNGQGKWLLRQVLGRRVPTHLTDRPKMGFGIPLGEWLRGELRDWAQAQLDPAKIKAQGLFDPVPIQAAWRQHLKGSHDHHRQLWPVLMFTAWYDRWMAGA